MLLENVNSFWALEETRSKDAVKPLMELVKKGSTYERRAAFSALITIGDPEAMAFVRGLSGDSDPYLARMAQKTDRIERQD